MELHGAARCKEDHHLATYLAKDFMDDQLESMNSLAYKMTQINRVGEGAGLYIYDKHLLKEERRRADKK